MRKTLLIARREYLAFVRTVGFWLSLFTVPLIIACSILIPIAMMHSAPAQTVAVLDLTGGMVDADLRGFIRQHQPPPPKPGNFGGGGGLRLVALPTGLTPDMTVEAAEAKIPALLGEKGVSTIVVAYDRGDTLHFHIWSDQAHKGDLVNMIQWDLHGLQFYKVARMNGVTRELAHDMREARADIVSLTPASVAPGKGNELIQGMKDKAPQVMAAMVGYLSWTAIFSSSMILLGSVIEEKSSKVLEVLLASASTGSLLLGKVLGVAGVMLTVAAIWATVIGTLGTYGFTFLPPGISHAIAEAVNGMFSPVHVSLLLTYFITGYLMYGVMFAAIGAFCETQKDAQAVMGPVMMVMMIPMIVMQVAFRSTEVPALQYMSYFPLFTPFLMPLRLAQPLPWYEIAGTLVGMGVVAMLMIRMGSRAFRHGALSGVKLSWGALLGMGRKD